MVPADYCLYLPLFCQQHIARGLGLPWLIIPWHLPCFGKRLCNGSRDHRLETPQSQTKWGLKKTTWIRDVLCTQHLGCVECAP